MISRYQKLRERCRRAARLEKPQVNAKLVAKNTLVLYFRMLAVMLVGLFTSRIQLQALGVSDYGLYQVAMATVSMFCFLSGSLGMASSRFLTVEMGKGTIGSLKRVFSTVLTVHFILAAVIVLVLETIGLLVLNTKLNIDPSRLAAVKWAYQCGVFTTFLSITQVPYGAAIVAHERMSAFAYMSFYDVGVKLLIVYLLFVSPFDRLVFYATLLALSSCTTIAIYRIYCVRNFTEARYRKIFDKSLMRPIFAFTGWQIASKFAITLATQGLVMVNQRYFGPALVAASTLAGGVNGYLQSFVDNFKMAANPQIIKLFANRQYQEAKGLLSETILFSLFLLLALGMPLCFYSPEALHIWLGDNVPPYAAEFVRIFIIGSVATLFDSSFFTIIYADGRMRTNTLCDIVSFGSMFAVACGMIHFTRNPYSAALALVAAYGIQGLVQKPILLHFVAGYGFKDYARIFVPAAVAIVLTTGVTWGVWSFLRGIYWAVPAGMLAAVLNAFVLFSFVASRRVQDQAVKMLERFGSVGRPLANCAAWYVGNVNALRASAITWTKG